MVAHLLVHLPSGELADPCGRRQGCGQPSDRRRQRHLAGRAGASSRCLCASSTVLDRAPVTTTTRIRTAVYFALCKLVTVFTTIDPYNGPRCRATCCGCGDAFARVAVWAPSSAAESHEGWCEDCYWRPRAGSDGFWSNCTSAPLPHSLTNAQADAAALVAYPSRKPVALWLTAP